MLFALLFYAGFKLKVRIQYLILIPLIFILGNEFIWSLLDFQYQLFKVNYDATTWIPYAGSNLFYPTSLFTAFIYSFILPFPYYFGFFWLIFTIDILLLWKSFLKYGFRPLSLAPIIIITMITPVFGTLVRYRAPFMTLYILLCGKKGSPNGK